MVVSVKNATTETDESDALMQDQRNKRNDTRFAVIS